MEVVCIFPFYGITFSIGKICISFDVNFYTLAVGIFCHYSHWVSKEANISAYLGPLRFSIEYNAKRRMEVTLEKETKG